MSDVLQQLAQILEQRKQESADKSYVASLYAKGLNSILKIQIIYETADLWFHCMVLLAYQDLKPDDVLQELQRRFGLSGLEEKAQRNK